MKHIDLSNVDCPRCSLKKLYVTQFEDSQIRIVRCASCWWWTYLKYFNKKPYEQNRKEEQTEETLSND